MGRQVNAMRKASSAAGVAIETPDDDHLAFGEAQHADEQRKHASPVVVNQSQGGKAETEARGLPEAKVGFSPV